jgi:hypothetical protein
MDIGAAQPYDTFLFFFFLLLFFPACVPFCLVSVFSFFLSISNSIATIARHGVKGTQRVLSMSADTCRDVGPTEPSAIRTSMHRSKSHEHQCQTHRSTGVS